MFSHLFLLRSVIVVDEVIVVLLFLLLIAVCLKVGVFTVVATVRVLGDDSQMTPANFLYSLVLPLQNSHDLLLGAVHQVSPQAI